MRNVRISRIWWSPGGGGSEGVLIRTIAPGPPERVDRSWQRRAEAEGGGLLLAELAELAEM